MSAMRAGINDLSAGGGVVSDSVPQYQFIPMKKVERKKVKILFRFLALMAAVMIAQPLTSQVPAGAPAGTTGLCKDGTYSSAASKSGACGGWW